MLWSVQTELTTLFQQNPICFPKHHSSNVWKLNSNLKTKQQCICRDRAKKPEYWQDLKLKEPSLQNVTIFSRPGILFGALIYSNLHYFYSVTPFTSCVTPTWDVTKSTSSTWISRYFTNLTIKTKKLNMWIKWWQTPFKSKCKTICRVLGGF